MTEPLSKEDALDQISEEYLGVVWRENTENVKGALMTAFEVGWYKGYTEANHDRDVALVLHRRPG